MTTTQLQVQTEDAGELPIRFHLELPMGPDWKNIELLRSAILNCLVAVFDDPDLSNAVGTVTSELLENAIKYGEWTRQGVRYLVLVAKGTHDAVEIQVRSPLDPASPDYAELLKTIAEIEAYASPREAYIARMLEIADAPSGTGVSRMGLARIAYEGPCRLEAHLDGSMLSVKATVQAPQES